jgi:hypothetical protein
MQIPGKTSPGIANKEAAFPPVGLPAFFVLNLKQK